MVQHITLDSSQNDFPTSKKIFNSADFDKRDKAPILTFDSRTSFKQINIKNSES